MSGPEPVEWTLDTPAVVVRGMIWQGEKLPVLFIHEPGPENDLDRWRSLPELVHMAGHTAVTFDLPNHGLSEGDSSGDAAIAAVEHICRQLVEAHGTAIAIVTEGSSCQLLPPAPLAALILFSPIDDAGAQTPYPKLVFAGSGDSEARAAADRYLRASRGWTLVSSFATTVQGAELLDTIHGQKIAAQVVAFLRDYS